MKVWNAALGNFVDNDNMDRGSRLSGQGQQYYQQGSNAGQNWNQGSFGRPSNNQDQMVRGFQDHMGKGQDHRQLSQHCSGRGQQGHDGRGQGYSGRGQLHDDKRQYLHENNRSQDQEQQSHYVNDRGQQVHWDRGQGHNSNIGQGHNYRGQSHNDRRQGHDERRQGYDGRWQDSHGNRGQDRGQEGYDGRGKQSHDDRDQQDHGGRGQGRNGRGQGCNGRGQGHSGRGQGHIDRRQGHDDKRNQSGCDREPFNYMSGSNWQNDNQGDGLLPDPILQPLMHYQSETQMVPTCKYFGREPFNHMSGSNWQNNNQGDGLLPDPILQPLMPYQSETQMVPTFKHSLTNPDIQSPQQWGQTLSRGSSVFSLNTGGANSLTGDMNRCQSTASINSVGSNNQNSIQTQGNRKQRRRKELNMPTHFNNTNESDGPGIMVRSSSVRSIDDIQDLGARSKQFIDLQKYSIGDNDSQHCLRNRGRGRSRGGRGGSTGCVQHSEISHNHRQGIGNGLSGSSRGRTINNRIRPDNSSETIHEPGMASARGPVVNRGMNNMQQGTVNKNGRGAVTGARETSGAYVGNEEANINITGNEANQILLRGRGARGIFRGRGHGFAEKQYSVNEDASTCSGSAKDDDFDEDMSTTSDISCTVSNIADDLSEAGVNDENMSTTSDISCTVSNIADDLSEAGVDDANGEISLGDINTVRLGTLKNRITRYDKKLARMRKKNEYSAKIKQFIKQLEELKRIYCERVQNENDPNKLMSQNISTDIKHKDPNNIAKDEIIVDADENNMETPITGTNKCSRKPKVKRVHTSVITKGHVSFKAKSNENIGGCVFMQPAKHLSNGELSHECEEVSDAENGQLLLTCDGRTVYNNVDYNETDHDVENLVTDSSTNVKSKNRRKNRTKRKKNKNEVPQETNIDCIRKLILKFDDILIDTRTAATDKQCLVPHQQPVKADSKQDATEKVKQPLADTKKRNPSNASSEPDVNKVVKFLVKTLHGKGQPEEIVRESGLFPVDFDDFGWFRKMDDRFNVLERNGIIIEVFVYYKNATYCMDYISKASCSKDDCQRYHVCKHMLSGLCVYGEICRFSHDLLDERNKKISKQLDFNNVFTNDDICSILRVRFPHICPTWVKEGFCRDPTCKDLHLCPRYVLDQCLQGNTCSMIHNTLSEHNKSIMQCFRMEKWKDVLFKRAVYMIQQLPVETDEPSEPIETNAKETDPSDDIDICDLDLTGSCCQNCNNIHSSLHLPYLWQVKFFGSWFTHPMSEKLEQAFCDDKLGSDIVVLTHNGILLKVELIFKPSIVAFVVRIDDDSIMHQADVRRLSTPSYVDSNDGSASFNTQWRWYWQDDHRIWNLFEPDTLQHTLERKFLAKQSDYNYSRNNYEFKYSIDFNAMVQQNIDTRKRRAIKRCPIFISSNDVENKSFPKSLSAAPVIDTPLPVGWVPWDLAHPFELVKLDEDSVDYQKVSGSFYKTLDRQQQTIESIFRLQNHKLWSLFCNQEKIMEANFQRIGSKLPLNKLYLFHGTDSLDAVRGICINNFDNRVSGKNATMYGDGAYFAKDARYSHRYTKPPLRFMFMVPVLVGQYTKGNQTYRRPPNKPGSDHELFDSCVNDVVTPSIYVLFDKNQYYPELLIHYKNLYEEDIDNGVLSSRRTSTRAHGHVPSANVRSTYVSGSSAYTSGIHTTASAGGSGVTSYPSYSSQSTQPTVYPGHQPAVYPGYLASSHTGSPTPAQSPTSSVSNPYSPSSQSNLSPQGTSSLQQHSTLTASSETTAPAPQPKKQDSSCCIQ